MNDRVKVFFCDPTGEATYVARAWHREDATCDGEGRRELGRFPLDQRPTFPSGLRLPCAKCGEALAVCSQSQNQVYRRTDTAAEVGGEQPLPAGAI